MNSTSNSNDLFNKIASVYGLFFNYQVKKYRDVLKEGLQHINLPEKATILDIGCGTGALYYCLKELGFNVFGVDVSPKMIDQAMKRNPGSSDNLEVGNVLKGLHFHNKSFDIIISSFVIHGMDRESRIKVYNEASRLAKNIVIFHDYNTKRSLLIDFAEWMEKGDYFNFIKSAEIEMKDNFSKVDIINMGQSAAWYICTP